MFANMKEYDKVPSKFGRRVRQLRIELSLSQEQFAALCNLDRTYISSIERGQRNVSLKNIAAIAKALDVSLSDLFEGIVIDDNTG